MIAAWKPFIGGCIFGCPGGPLTFFALHVLRQRDGMRKALAVVLGAVTADLIIMISVLYGLDAFVRTKGVMGIHISDTFIEVVKGLAFALVGFILLRYRPHESEQLNATPSTFWKIFAAACTFDLIHPGNWGSTIVVFAMLGVTRTGLLETLWICALFLAGMLVTWCFSIIWFSRRGWIQRHWSRILHGAGLVFSGIAAFHLIKAFWPW